MLFGELPICPALVDAGSRYACGLIVNPELYYTAGNEAEGARRSGELLGIGTYCDAIESDADRAVADRYS